MSHETIVHCDACGKRFPYTAYPAVRLTTPFVVSLAQPGSYCYGRPDEEHPIPFQLGDICIDCRLRLTDALKRALAEIPKKPQFDQKDRDRIFGT